MGDDQFDSEVSSPSSSSSSVEHNTLLSSSDDHCKENKHNHVNDDEDDDEEYDDDDDDDDSYANDLNTELACPFCFEGFDAVGLFCHVDDVHPIHSKSGICPICGGNLGTNLAGHLSTQHNTILKAFRKKIRQCDGDFHLVVSLLKKELKDVHMLQQQSQGSHPSSSSSSSKLEADPLLSSFIYSSPLNPAFPPPSSQSEANNTALQSGIQKLRLSANDEEKARRCEFVSSLIFSTIHDDDDDV